MAEDMGNQEIIASITRAADILKILAEGVNRITDVSRGVGLSKSTTHRFLKSLEMSGLVTRDRLTRRYHLGPLSLNLASKPIIAHQTLIACAFEDMRRLRDLTGETVVLHVRIGLERICLEELQSLQNLKYTAGKGATAPIYTGSAGKILLSHLEDNELQPLLKHLQLVPIGPNTITDKDRLLEELKIAKEQGYATSFGERISGSASISVPVENYLCPVALSVLGPDNRFSLGVIMELLREIKEGAAQISRNLCEVSPKEGK
jgi:DNA-binding IclR family transcriptional regulator